MLPLDEPVLWFPRLQIGGYHLDHTELLYQPIAFFQIAKPSLGMVITLSGLHFQDIQHSPVVINFSEGFGELSLFRRNHFLFFLPSKNLTDWR
jgi:hypothetical protein